MAVKVYLANGETVVVPQGKTASFETLKTTDGVSVCTEIGSFLTVLDKTGYSGNTVAAFRKEEVLGFVVEEETAAQNKGE